jgi:hypothetical protein
MDMRHARAGGLHVDNEALTIKKKSHRCPVLIRNKKKGMQFGMDHQSKLQQREVYATKLSAG